MDVQTAQLLAHLWRDGQFAYWYGIDEVKTFLNKRTGLNEPCKTSFWFPSSKPAAIPTSPTLHVYFGVNPSCVRREKWQRSTIPTVAAINCLFGEVDAKAFTDGMAGVRSHVASLDPRPSVTIFSGGGLHCYWLLHAPYLLNDTNRDATKLLLYRWVDRVGTDPASKDLCRVLRVPGTRNVKAAYGPNYPTVTIEHLDMDMLYDLGELAALVPQPPQRQRPASERPVGTPSTSWNDRVAQVRTASAGTLHMTLRRVSCNAGWYVAYGSISEGQATAALTAAASAAGAIDMSNVAKTIASGIEKGRGFYEQSRRFPPPDDWSDVDMPTTDWNPPARVQLASW